ncbi:MAG: hypothetical protein R3F49_10900 [Planctomycetota bacterium]
MRCSYLLALLVFTPVASSQATLDTSPDAIARVRAIDAAGDIFVGEDSAVGVTAIIHIDTRGAVFARTALAVPGALFHVANGVSADGTIVAGRYNSGGLDSALRWNVATQQSLRLPPALGMPHSMAAGISGDGEYIVGRSRPFVPLAVATGAVACRWNSLGDVEVLWPTSPLGTGGAATATNADGSVVIGFEQRTSGVVPIRWEEGFGPSVLPSIAGFESPVPVVVSGDGRVVAGYALDGTTQRVGWRYVEGQGMTILEAPPGSAYVLQPIGISHDGSKIAFDVSDGVAVWTEWNGMQRLDDYLAARGLALPPPSQAYLGVAMSSDGTTFVFADSFLGATSIPPKFRARDGSSNALGTTSCTPATVNSTGFPATLAAAGVDYAAANDLELRARGLPAGSLVLFLVSRTTAGAFTPANSIGSLCLNGSIGRYLRPGEAGGASAGGFRDLRLDLMSTPQPAATVSIVAGETWYFQAWFRDVQAGLATSNLTPAVGLTFR